MAASVSWSPGFVLSAGRPTGYDQRLARTNDFVPGNHRFNDEWNLILELSKDAKSPRLFQDKACPALYKVVTSSFDKLKWVFS